MVICNGTLLFGQSYGYSEQSHRQDALYSQQSVTHGFAPAEAYVSDQSHVSSGEPQQTKFVCGVDEHSARDGNNESRWSSSRLIPWETYSYGEYVGPARTPHVPTYRLRVDDQIEFVYQITRDNFGQGYRLSPGDTVRVTAAVDERLNESTRLNGIVVMPDGTISIDLLGSVLAAGKTVQQLKAELERHGGRDRNRTARLFGLCRRPSWFRRPSAAGQR